LNYRLPTEEEWEYAAGNGRLHTKYTWGNDEPKYQVYANVGDISLKTYKIKDHDESLYESFVDGQVLTSFVGIFPPNKFELFDLLGNVSEWCYGSSVYLGYAQACIEIQRGGDWMNPLVSVSNRGMCYTQCYSNVGFRVAITK
jgi:formylglycine-generating enzyme required for sulfatase activity